ncbi:unnamed protein product, partial [marine sediment metagenome]
MTISERVKNINPSQTLAITPQALKMKKEGKKVISFGAGEPDFDTPENIGSIDIIGSDHAPYTKE